ncbi:MAG TPA: PKD domain-containing protein, partial [Bacteroidetes bacterium]|nr:PKD domain-containing protein [Bacteroidota bacterium]
DPQGLSCVWSNGSTGPTTVLDSAGIYSVICTDSNGCTASDTIELLAVTPYIAGLDADTTVCSGTTLTICAPAGPVSYTWSNGDTSNCATFSNSGIYSLLTQDSLGCMYHDTIEVIHENAPLSAFVLDTSNCPIIRFTDQSTGFPSAWSWDFGDGATDTTQNPAHTYASNGTYTVLATASNFCGIDSATTTITIACLVGRPAPMDAALLVYPNPGNGLFHLASELNISGETTLKAWDINGRLVREQQIRSLGTPFASVLDLRGETPGIYLIRLHTEQGSWFAKVRLLE